MQKSNMVFTFLINGVTHEIKAQSAYAAKKVAKRRAGTPGDCEYLGKREDKR